MKQEIKKLSSIILMLCAVVLCTCCQDEDYTAKFKNVDCQDIIGRVYMNDRQIDIEPVLSRDEITPFGYIGEEGIVILSLKNKEAEIRELKPKYIRFSGKAKFKKAEDLDVGGTCYYDLKIDKYQEVFPQKDSRTISNDDVLVCGTNENVAPPEWFFFENANDEISLLDLNQDSIRIFVHVVRKEDSYYYNKDRVTSNILMQLNNYFNPYCIAFKSIGNEYIDNPVYVDSISTTYNTLFNENCHNNALDIYVIGAYNCNWSESEGTYIGGKAQDIISSALIILGSYYDSNTLIHELGHCLGLYHTHRGSPFVQNEGGIAEYVDGSNSLTAGDYITDTPADPGLNSFGGFDSSLTDGHGHHYAPDIYNMMSYARDIRNSFTPKQCQRIKACMRNEASIAQLVIPYTAQIAGPRHFSSSATYTIPGATANDNVVWTITETKQTSSNSSTIVQNTLTGPTITLSSNAPATYRIQASLLFRGQSTTTSYIASCGIPSPVIGCLSWTTNTGNYGVTSALDNGTSLPANQACRLSLSYSDNVGALSGNSCTYTLRTSTGKLYRGSTMNISANDMTSDLYIYVTDACGRSSEPFIIPVN